MLIHQLHDLICIEHSGPPVFALQQTEKVHIPDLDTGTDEERKTRKKHVILCRFCSAVITAQENSIEKNGLHSHTFTNPMGHIFTIGCFARADGCKIFGEPTFEYTWFPGYSWNFAICSACNAHLGWFYQSNGDGFFGLILKYLVENS